MSFFSSIFKRPSKKKWIIVPDRIELLFDDDFMKGIHELKTYSWTHKYYRAEPAMAEKRGGTLRPYLGQQFDENYFDIVPDGWSHDHCEICYARISDDVDEEDENEGYFSEGSWLCTFCYFSFVKPDDLFESLKKFKIIEK